MIFNPFKSRIFSLPPALLPTTECKGFKLSTPKDLQRLPIANAQVTQ